VYKQEIHDLGGAIVSVRSEAQYLKFEIAEMVQNWRQKWFYIKDHKSSESDQYGLAPFDLAKSLTKLKSWDALLSEAEAKEIQPLSAQILEPMNAAKKELNQTQLMVFFPLQTRISKL
jgi:hypothetical protein